MTSDGHCILKFVMRIVDTNCVIGCYKTGKRFPRMKRVSESDNAKIKVRISVVCDQLSAADKSIIPARQKRINFQYLHWLRFVWSRFSETNFLMGPPSSSPQKTAHLVLSALGDLSSQRGASIKKICDHVSKEYAVTENDFKRMVKKTLDRGIALGAIKKIRGGRYTLGELVNYVKSIKIRGPRIETMKRRRKKSGNRVGVTKKKRRRRRKAA